MIDRPWFAVNDFFFRTPSLCPSRISDQLFPEGVDLAGPSIVTWDNSVPTHPLPFSRGYLKGDLPIAALLPLRRTSLFCLNGSPSYSYLLSFRYLAAWRGHPVNSRRSGIPFAHDLCHVALCSCAAPFCHSSLYYIAEEMPHPTHAQSLGSADASPPQCR